jgi:hypothetical protein
MHSASPCENSQRCAPNVNTVGSCKQHEARGPGQPGADQEVAVAGRKKTGGAAPWRAALRRIVLEAGPRAASSPTQASNRSPRMNRASAGGAM